MRKTNIMLIAALVASPLALANEYDSGYYDYGYGDDGNLTIEGSGNVYVTKDAELNVTKSAELDYVGNTDDDALKLKHVGNTHKLIDEYNVEADNSIIKDIDKELNKVLAESKLYGHVMDATVTYGGACCKGHSSPLDLTVNQDNWMDNGSFGGVSGINIAGQNVGNNSLVQQNTSTNAALVGAGDAVGGSGSGY